MLHGTNQKHLASNLCCVWVPTHTGVGAPLTAIWIERVPRYAQAQHLPVERDSRNADSRNAISPPGGCLNILPRRL
jgi:hypothetical protein